MCIRDRAKAAAEARAKAEAEARAREEAIARAKAEAEAKAAAAKAAEEDPLNHISEMVRARAVSYTHLAKYAMPYEFEYRDKLPQTLVGKVAYTVLEKEELAKLDKLEA